MTGARLSAKQQRKEWNMDLGGASWAIITVIGGFTLAGVIFWAMVKNKAKGPADIERTERATRELYKEEDAAHRRDNDFGT